MCKTRRQLWKNWIANRIYVLYPTFVQGRALCWGRRRMMNHGRQSFEITSNLHQSQVHWSVLSETRPCTAIVLTWLSGLKLRTYDLHKSMLDVFFLGTSSKIANQKFHFMEIQKILFRINFRRASVLGIEAECDFCEAESPSERSNIQN